jgi:hypothetical protein
MRTFALALMLSAVVYSGCCTISGSAPEGPAVSDWPDNAESVEPRWRPRWLRGPWANPQEFIEDSLLAIHVYSFGERTWLNAGGLNEQHRRHIARYNDIRREGTRPFPVVLRASNFAPQDLPTKYPDTLTVLYGQEDLREYLQEQSEDGDVFVLYLGHYDDGWIPMTYMSLKLSRVSLNRTTGEIHHSGDYHNIAGWIYRRAWQGKATARLKIETTWTS